MSVVETPQSIAVGAKTGPPIAHWKSPSSLHSTPKLQLSTLLSLQCLLLPAPSCMQHSCKLFVCGCPSDTVGDVSIGPNSSPRPVPRAFMMSFAVLPTKGKSWPSDLHWSVGWSSHDVGKGALELASSTSAMARRASYGSCCTWVLRWMNVHGIQPTLTCFLECLLHGTIAAIIDWYRQHTVIFWLLVSSCFFLSPECPCVLLLA